MMNAAWARLMMLRMPHTIENPSPISARMQPWSRPLITCCRTSILDVTSIYDPSPFVPGGGGPDGLAVGGFGGPDGDFLTRLPLFDRHGLVDVDAPLVEFDLAVERDEVELRDRVAYCFGVQRA